MLLPRSTTNRKLLGGLALLGAMLMVWMAAPTVSLRANTSVGGPLERQRIESRNVDSVLRDTSGARLS